MGAKQTSPMRASTSENHPGCVKTQKTKDDENNFPKSIAAEQALEV
jgi:hypothetical protein